MTDRQFIKRMIALTEKLSDVYNVEPLDQEARLAILNEIHETSVRFNLSRRRDSWQMFFAIICLLWILAWVVFEIFYHE